MKRLFIGGLGHTVSEKDLRDRFGKFGDVSDVEIKTRKDENGSPLKTFAYININLSDSDYKRCMSILNKSKWKGGTLQIELAKESFLHRLAEERQQAAERVHTPKTDPQENIVEAFKAAGVENFHMKAAVPGTEVSGHKNWVVSKFGRVLPVLHLSCQRKSKIFKYDPSKYCHNIKKLDSEEVFTPVSKLTWEIDGGYDEISKKRRGEFPPQKKYLKKAKKDLPISTISCGISKVTTNENSTLTLRDDLSAKVKQKPLEKKSLSFFHSDADSEDEIRMLVAQELSHKQKLPADIEVDDDNLEVVGDDFVVKSNMFWGEDNGVKSQLLLKSSKNDEDYDSADTDEILNQNKNPGKREDPIKSDVVNEHSFVKSSKAKKVKRNTVGGKQELGSIGLENSDKSSKSINSDYDAMMENCEPLDLSLAASQSLVKDAEETSDVEHGVSLTEQQAGPSELSNSLPISETKSLRPSKKSGNNPEDILAFLFGPDIEKEKTKTVKSSLPAFVGTKDLFAFTSEPSGSSLKRPAEKINCEARDEPKRVKEAAKTSPKKNALEDRSKDQLSKTSHQEHSSTCEDPEQSTLMKDMDDSEDSSSESIDSDYEAMMGNCQRLDLSLADLESLVNNANEISDDDETSDNEESDGSGSEPQAGPSELPKSLSFSKTNSPSTSSKKSGNNPEDIVAFLLEPDVEKEEKTKTMKSSLPAFVGTKNLFGSTSEPSGLCLKTPAEKIDCEVREDPKRLKEDSKTKKSAIADRSKGQLSADSSACGDPEQFTCSNKVENIQKSSSSSEFSSSIDEKESCNVNSFSGTAEKSITSASKASRMTKLADESALPTSEADSSSSTSTEDSETSDEEEEAALKVSKVATSKVLSNSKHLQKSTDTVKQQQDNQKRLAALEQRQKETEEQKKLIQGALSKLDVPNANKGKHIVFDSDDEVNDDEENTTPQKKSLFEEDSQSEEEDPESLGAEKQRKEKDFEKAGGSKLFDNSEDEDDEDAEEDRFQIKPQFEGKAGQKLMELQSRFGTDPRFQMDAKFLDNDDEAEEQDAESQVPEQEELIEEKKRNLAILQSVLNISIQPSNTSKEAAKGKTFRDISNLHYDPTSEAHAAFETKREPTKKESKAARRKKREEAQKLPEVSKEIYYDVAVDLKEVFGASKESQNEKKEELSWDKVDDEKEDKAEEQEETPMFSFSSSVETGKDASSGFKFSFLGVDTTTEKTSKTEEYKIETLKGAKVSWQTDPHFQDSSSEDDDNDDEEDKDENKDQSASTSATTEEPAPTKAFFFFYDGDLRLKEGPKLFCRRQKLEEQKDAWEERRTQLRQAYRKRHKNAKRRQKAENN